MVPVQKEIWANWQRIQVFLNPKIVTKLAEIWVGFGIQKKFVPDPGSKKHGWDLAEWLERLAVNAIGATVLGSILASYDTVEYEGRQMKQCWITYIKRKNHKKLRVSDPGPDQQHYFTVYLKL